MVVLPQSAEATYLFLLYTVYIIFDDSMSLQEMPLHCRLFFFTLIIYMLGSFNMKSDFYKTSHREYIDLMIVCYHSLSCKFCFPLDWYNVPRSPPWRFYWLKSHKSGGRSWCFETMYSPNICICCQPCFHFTYRHWMKFVALVLDL